MAEISTPIRTRRLLLREYRPEDETPFAEFHQDRRIAEFHGPGELTTRRAVELVGTFQGWAAERPRRNWQLAVALLNEPESLVGSCGLRGEGLEAGWAEFGLEIAPSLWGRGLGAEASSALLSAGFRELDLLGVQAWTVDGNHRIARLLRRLGFREERSRPGPGWMRERGWCEVEWRLDASPLGH